MTAALNGRGGGKPEFQQGSLKATRQQIEAFFTGK
jgi:alanyl-tRNA synthetase